MQIEPFVLERNQSLFENQVEINLSESGVHPLTVRELLADCSENEVLDLPLTYPQTNGTPELRRAIAATYPGATEECVTVTNGGSEANFLAAWKLVEPGAEVVMMVPNYLQAWGILRGFGANVRPWNLRPNFEANRWAADLKELESVVTKKTSLIALCNPNNPTGARFTDPDLDRIVDLARANDCWILSDEIYRGAELSGDISPTLFGQYEKVIVTAGLSKAYGLPGLRIGWAVTTPSMAEDLWSYHDYTSIAPGALSERLARIALAPEKRSQLLGRTRRWIRENHEFLTEWLCTEAPDLISIPPLAGAIAMVHHPYASSSEEIVHRMRREKGVLLVPGEHFHLDSSLRIGFGCEKDHLAEGLSRLGELLKTLEVSAQ